MGELATVVVQGSKIEKAKLVMGFFLASEFAFFSFLILAYVDFQHAFVSAGPTPEKTLDPATMGIYTFFLLASSPTMWYATRMFRQGKRRAFHIWMIVTVIFGLVFLYGEGSEYADMIMNKGIDLETNAFGTTFFTLTGFHGFHLFIGLCLLTITLGISLKRGLYGRRQSAALEAVSLYWHFVDAMWVFIFSVVYLWSALT